MSWQAREWVWEHSASRGTGRLVLLAIADRVPDEQCIAWASLNGLAKRTNASRSTVRTALDRLLADGELEELDHLTGPQRSTVYRMPLAAARHPAREEAEEPPDTLIVQISSLRDFGIRPREVPDLPSAGREPAGPVSGTSRRKLAHRGTGLRHSGVPEPGTQNRREPNGRYSSSGGAAVTTAAQWQVDAAAHTWARRQGHLDRLGEAGLAAADAKWRAHRAGWDPRPSGSWAADWRHWIAREHAPRAHSSASHSKNAAGGMTRADAHTAALLAALDEAANGSE